MTLFRDQGNNFQKIKLRHFLNLFIFSTDPFKFFDQSLFFKISSSGKPFQSSGDYSVTLFTFDCTIYHLAELKPLFLSKTSNPFFKKSRVRKNLLKNTPTTTLPIPKLKIKIKNLNPNSFKKLRQLLSLPLLLKYSL